MSKKRSSSSSESAPGPKRPHRDMPLEDIRASVARETERADAMVKKAEELRKEALSTRFLVLYLEWEIKARGIEALYKKASAAKDMDLLMDVLQKLGMSHINRKVTGPRAHVKEDGSLLVDIFNRDVKHKFYDVRYTISNDGQSMKRGKGSKKHDLWHPDVQSFLYEILRVCRIPLKHAHLMFPVIFVNSE